MITETAKFQNWKPLPVCFFFQKNIIFLKISQNIYVLKQRIYFLYNIVKAILE